MTDGIVYRGDNEDERRDSAIMHTRMLDHINRLQRVGFPLTDGDMAMFGYLEQFVIEVPEGYTPPAQQVPPPEPVPMSTPAAPPHVQAPPPVQEVPPTPVPSPSPKPRGRIRPVD